jgi:hypothetical protein
MNMDMDTEGPAVVTWMDEVFTRVKYGHPDYCDHVQRHLTLETECALADRRNALLQEEHSASWVGNASAIREEAIA